VILHQASTAGAFVTETEPSQLGQLAALSCVLGGSTCYATGIDISDGYPDDVASSSNGGVSWSFNTTAGVSGDPWISINAIDCTNAATCLVDGASYEGPIFAWTSNGWSSYSSGLYTNGYSAYLDALACADSSFCLAVGRYANYTGPVTGGSWGDETPNPGSPAQGFGAVCVSSSTCAFVGTTSAYPASGGPAAIYTTSNAGSTWHSDSVPSTADTLFAVACSPGELCFAVGQDSSSQALVLIDTGDALTATPAKARLGGKNPSTDTTQTSCGDPVDCATGDLFETYTDAQVAGIVANLSLERTYNSLAADTTGIFGFGWSCSYCMSLAIDPTLGQATVTQENGSVAVFPASGSGTFYAPSWEQATLVQDSDGDYAFTRRGQEIFTFSSSGQLLSVSDPDGDTTQLAYNASGQLTTVTDPSGRALTFSYNSSGLVSSVTDPMNRVTQYGYGSSGNLTSVTDPLGRVTSFTYDSTHDLLTITKPNGQSGGPDAGDKTTNGYNSAGQVISQTDPAGRVMTWSYGAGSGGLPQTVVTDPDGNETLYSFDTNGELVSMTKAYGTTAAATWTYIYDPTTLGQASVTDPNGNATSETYDADGNVVSKTNGLGRTWTYTYNSFDEQTCAASPQAPSPCSALSPPTAVTAGSSTITPPSSAPPAYVTYTEYDTNGNKIWTTTGAYAPGSSTASYARTTYDLYGGESVTLGGTTDSCDAVPPSSALPCATIDARGTVTQLDYDSDGDLSSSATPDDNASTISTFAGGVMGPVLGTDIAQSPGSVMTVTIGGTKYAYVTDEWNDVIRRINLSSDEEQVVAGNYAWGHVQGIGGPATSAELCGPVGSSADSSGDLVIADSCANMIDYVPATSGTYFGQAMTAGDIYTIAGDGTAGSSGDNGAATSAELNGPSGVAIAPSGAIAIADTSNNRTRFVPATSGTYFGRSMTAGDIYTIAGNGTAGYLGDTGAATSAELSGPQSVTFDASGDLAVADTSNNVIRFVPVSTGSYFGRSMAADDIYTIAGNGTAGYSGNGAAATSAELSAPYAVAFDAAGDLAIADSRNNVVRFVPVSSGSNYGQSMSADDIYTVAGTGTYGDSGNGTAATSAPLGDPVGIAVDAAGDLFIASDWAADVRVVAAGSGNLAGQSVTADDIYLIAGNGSYAYSGDGGPAGQSELSTAQQVRVDSAGDVVITDAGDNVIRFVPASTGTFFGRSMTARDIYTIAGDGGGGDSGDGAAATSAELDNPGGAEIGPAGGTVIADPNNNMIRYVANTSGTHFGRVMTAGDIYTIAGTGMAGYSGNGASATSAELYYPSAVAFDAAGDVVIADSSNSAVRFVPANSGTYYGQIMTVGDIYTIAGTGTSGYSGESGTATSAELSWSVNDATVDPAGDLYITDSGNDVIRFVPVRSGSYFGREMAADDIYTVAGAGWTTQNFSGDEGAATSATFDWPGSAAPDPSGGLYVADYYNNRIRHVVADNALSGGLRLNLLTPTIGTFAGGVMDTMPATSAAQRAENLATATVGGTMYAYVADGTNNVIRRINMSTGREQVVAGNYASGPQGVGGPATSAELEDPGGVAADNAGDLVIADTSANLVDFVPATSGTYFGQVMTAGDIYIVAGNGNAGYSGDGNPATSAELDGPYGVAIAASGAIAIADTWNNVIRFVPATSASYFGRSMTAGDIYTIAGNGTLGYSGDANAATSAELYQPPSVAADAAGDLAIADTGNNVIRFVPDTSGTYFGRSMTAGYIYTVAGNGTVGYSGDDLAATSAELSWPYSTRFDASGDLAIADTNNNVIRFVAASAGTHYGQSMSVGDIYTVAGNGTAGSSGNGSAATSAELDGPDVAVDSAGDLVISDYYSENVRVVAASGGTLAGQTVAANDIYLLAGDGFTTYSGDGGPAGQSELSAPQLVRVDSTGDVVIADSGNDVIRFVPASTGTYFGQAMAAGDIYTIAGDGTCGCDGGDGGPATSAELDNPTGGEIGPAGNLAIADSGNNVIRFVPATSGTYFGRSMTADDIYTIAGDGTAGYSGSGVSATSAELDGPTGVAIDTAGGIVVADASNNVIRYVANTTGTYFGRSMIAGDIYTIAGDGTSGYSGDGNSATSAELSYPQTVALDGAGDVVVADSNNSAVRFLPASSGTYYGQAMTSGDIYTIAGNGTSGDSGDGTAATSAELSYWVADATADAAGDLYIADSGNDVIRFVPVSSGTYYGQAMTSDDIYTVAGIGWSSDNFSGDGGAPTSATLSWPVSAAPDPLGGYYVADAANNRLRQVTVPSVELATTTYTFDADGELLTAVSPDGNLLGANAANYTTTNAYNADDEVTSVTMAGTSGHTVTPRVTSYSYDADGNRTEVTIGSTSTTTTTYDADDEPTLVSDPDGHATLTCYDGDANIVETVRPVGVAANDLSASSCAFATLYPNGYESGSGVEYAPVSLASDATRTTYDALGNELTVTTPAPAGQSSAQVTTYTYDPGGRLTTVSSPPASNAESAPDQVTAYSYDAANELVSATTGAGTSASTTSSCYDPDGDKTASVPGDGNTGGVASCSSSSPWQTASAYETGYSYDSLGELVSETRPATTWATNGQTTTYTYDPDGNVLTSVDPDGVTTTNTYTSRDQLATVGYSGSSAPSVSYSYDANGNEVSMSDASGSSSYVYDPFSELISATNGAGKTVSYAYDSLGDETSVTYPLGSGASWASSPAITYGYDDAGNMTSVSDFNGTATTITNTADGLPASMSLGGSGATLSTTYDATGAPSAISLTKGSSTLLDFSYSRSPSGAIATETDTPSSSLSPASYGYDQLSRVTQMTPGTTGALNYSYDVSSNLKTLPTGASTNYDAAGELTSSTLSSTTTTYTYNADGELTAANGSSPTAMSAAWNGAGELTNHSDASADTSSAVYDGDGLRTSATTSPTSGSGSTQSFVWDITSSVPRLLMDSTNAYVYGPSGTAIKQVNLSTGSVSYLVGDALGSVRGVVSSGGSLTASTSYDAYGNPETTGGLSPDTPFGFAGGYTDPTGLIYLIGRYYDPQSGQFLSVDPLVDETGEPYSYTGGDPVNETDPSGECISFFNIICPGSGPVTSTVSLGFNPGAGANAIVNIGRGASFGLSNTIANWISPGASCTVAGNSFDQFLGGAGTSLVGGELLSGLGVAEDGAGAVARLPQDVAVDPSAPDALGLRRPISLSESQNEFLQGRIGDLQEQGATDFRVNQQQVDINGERVGINRPDLQYTLNGQRFYEEFETGSLEAALEHGPRILANDAFGEFVPWFVP
jgi:RHS repeat-associated protein